MRQHRPVSIAMSLACALAAGTAHAAIRFVDVNAAPGGNGASWLTASNDLRATLDASVRGDEVWIARGLYKPTTGTDRQLRFTVPPGVIVRGGFAGDESSINDRPADNDPLSLDPDFDTVLSGEIGAPGFGDNTFNLMNLEAADDATLVERIVLTRGVPGSSYPFNRGGGLRVSGGAPVFRDCLIIDNSASQGAGVFLVFSAQPLFDKCVIKNNSALDSAGVYVQTATGRFVGCRFEGNMSTSGTGGAVNFVFTSVGTFDDCTFVNNSCTNRGGAISSHNGSNVTVRDCTFTGNTGPTFPIGGGGGAITTNASTLVVERSVFENNTAGQGAAVEDQSGSIASYTDCVFRGGTGSFGGAAYLAGTSSTYTRCLFENNSSATAGAMMVNNAGTIVDCTFRDNTSTMSGTGGGAVYAFGSPTFTGCLFEGNAASVGAAAYVASTATFSRCRFLGNGSIASGGVLFGSTGSTTNVVNCLLAGNTATGFASAALFTSNSTASFINTTVVNNSGASEALRTFGNLTIRNSIFQNPTAEISGAANVSFSNIEGGFAGLGNSGADPLFVNAAMGDYSLAAGSPCIDAGDNAAVPVNTTMDLAGLPRFKDDPSTPDTGAGAAPVVDMGAFELQPPPSFCAGDANRDGVVSFPDITSVLINWATTGPIGDANNDGTVSFPDITSVLTNWGQSCS